ncbi:MAG TPA: hypothetical protein VGI10_11235 [Polyangiaceae bacterium]
MLDGDSFGLSMCLAAAAHCLGLSSPFNVAASAVVDGDGVLFEVGGLGEKLGVLHDWALGVETVIVAAGQLEEARTIAKELGASWQIIPARTVADAVVAAFPNLWSDLAAHWNDPAKVAQVAADLLRLARDGSNQVLSWKGIADAAERVVARLPEQSHAAKEARFAHLVALRHEGKDALLELDDEFLVGMRRPLRLRCLAHVVQSHGDCADMLDPAVERAVAATLPTDSRDDSVDDLWLIGAAGRTLAAFFRYESAEVALRRAVHGWFELDSTAKASHALCELLRVVALTDERESFSRLVHDYAGPFLQDPRTDAVSRGFVRYSLGRGHALLGDASEARRCLSDNACDWALLPDHLRATRLRWLIGVLRLDGTNVPPLEDCVQQLAMAVDRSPNFQFVAELAQLDRAQHDGADSSSALHAFETLMPREYRRFNTAYGGDLARRIAREFRY